MSKWSDDEIARLREFYGPDRTRPLGDLTSFAASLGRPKSLVARKARGLGLTNARRRKVLERKPPPPTMGPEELRRHRSERLTERHRTSGHPLLGKRLSPDACAKIGEASRAAWQNPTSRHHAPEAAQRRSDLMVERVRSGKMLAGPHTYSRAAAGRRADLDNRYFRSAWEANYARYLNWMKARGELLSWDYECRVFWFEKIKRGTRSYTPDFKVNRADGSHEWHEVKGWMDPKSRTRLDRMARYYPEERVVVIGEAWFKQAVRGGLAAIVPGWERKGDAKLYERGERASRSLRLPGL